MDGLATLGIAGGISVASFAISTATIVMKIGKWQGTVEQILKGHEKWMESHSQEKLASDKKFDDVAREQRQICKDQKEACAKVLEHIGGRVNGIKDK